MQACTNKTQTEDLNTLLTKSRNQVFNVIKNKVRNRDIAEDLLQDTFLEAHRSFHSFRHDSKFSTWLIGIAMNIVRNYYNRSPECRYDFVDDTHIEHSSGDSAYPYTLSHNNNVEKNLITADLADQVLDKIESLPEDMREILTLTVQDNLPYKDIAETFNTSVSNIKIKVFRAREKLKGLFDTPIFDELY